MTQAHVFANCASSSREVAEGSGHSSKWRISQPGDREELEADRVAEAVIGDLAPGVTGGDEGGPPVVQRACAACASGRGICPACSVGNGQIVREQVRPNSTLGLQVMRRIDASPDGNRREVPSMPAFPKSTTSSKPLAGYLRPLVKPSISLLGVTGLQAMLRVGPTDDPYEREADLVADQVMRMPDLEVCALPGVSSVLVRSIQRMCAECEEELAQRGADASMAGVGGPTPATFISGFGALKGGGQPLDSGLRAYFEPRFGRDFGGVRVHTGERASHLAADIEARAFTLGQEVVFGRNQYQPNADSGRRLVAHELVHTVQQGSGKATVQRRVCGPNPLGPPIGAAHPLPPGVPMRPCMLTEVQVQGSGQWCVDNHPHRDETCYRSIPTRTDWHDCPSGEQYCYTANYCCHASPDAHTPTDERSPAYPGQCIDHDYCLLAHLSVDVIPSRVRHEWRQTEQWSEQQWLQAEQWARQQWRRLMPRFRRPVRSRLPESLRRRP